MSIAPSNDPTFKPSFRVAPSYEPSSQPSASTGPSDEPSSQPSLLFNCIMMKAGKKGKLRGRTLKKGGR